MTKMKARNLRKDMNDELLPIRTVVDNQIHKTWADWAGMIASIGCAIHCAAMPMVLAYLPALGLGWLAGEEFHRLVVKIGVRFHFVMGKIILESGSELT